MPNIPQKYPIYGAQRGANTHESKKVVNKTQKVILNKFCQKKNAEKSQDKRETTEPNVKTTDLENEVKDSNTKTSQINQKPGKTTSLKT